MKNTPFSIHFKHFSSFFKKKTSKSLHFSETLHIFAKE